MTHRASRTRVGRRLASIAICLTAALASCAGPASPEKDVVIAVSYQDFQADHDFTGATEILAGGTLTIKLFSNATTGNLWSGPVLVSGPSLLELTGHEYLPPAVPNAGAGGHEVWTYRTVGTGLCRIRAEYKGYFDTTPTWTFSLDVSVH